MGNCLRHGKASWDDDDWGSLASTHRQEDDDGEVINITEKESLLGAKRVASLSSSSPSAREVKITISKKELEQLVRKVDMQGLTLEQVLVSMVKGGDVYELEHHRPWKPVLQSIPEVN
ncbi:PREDICTED: uncharacterized protein LOC18597142 [Theobroma cacao]|uniref:Uncharacterized protein LOC18597142 n=1 Tax=Theobroma cacao TaxID=3641 RepID=A0AB32WHA6_THECC|nr:PREDICTED: uncharacterized protein LOC18597142 [Theobroma cacao]